MDIKPDIMAQVMWEQGFDRLAGHIEAELGQAVLEAVLCDFMELVEGDVGGGATERDAGTLGGEDGVVEVALGVGESTGDGPGTGDIGDVVS